MTTENERPGPAYVIATYIKAKDGNRPHLMAGAFADTAILDVVVQRGDVAFAPHSIGLEAITDVLVRRFNQRFENVYTFCLAQPPTIFASTFECNWLVGMSEKDAGAVRVACGRYEWGFRDVEPRVAQRLKITIEQMEALPAGTLVPVMQWLSNLPYPWCSAKEVAHSAPSGIAQIPWLVALISQAPP
jgi:hypothetical protein